MDKWKGNWKERAAMRDAQRAIEGRIRWSHDCKGRLLTIREGLTVVPYEQTRGGWYAVVVEATTEADKKSYPRGGYNIVVTDDDVEKAIEREMIKGEVEERIEYETRSEWQGCRCGHPGAGCYCQPVDVKTGRFRIIRKFPKQVGEWQNEDSTNT